ncbi:hypothetical protein GBK43_10960, partial [Bifidobacterium longum]
FVSVASGHLTLLAVGQVLQRSLEPAQFLAPLRGGGAVRTADRGEEARASGFHGHGRAVFRISCGNGNAPRRLSSAPTAGPAGNGPGRGSHECEKPRVFLWGCVGLGRECFGYRESPLGRVLQGASCTCDAAACYSPTPCRVQYHRRARP